MHSTRTSLLHRLLAQISYAVLVKLVRTSLLMAGGIFLLAHTTPWKFLVSSFGAHDVVRRASWEPAAPPAVLAVGITDAGHARYFGGRSPLDRAALAQLVAQVLAASPAIQTLVIDLDTTPAGTAPVAPDDALLTTLVQHRDRIVLAQPLSGDDGAGLPWQQRLCAQGVVLGRPYVRTVFGSVDLSNQFEQSLADVAVHREASLCAEAAHGMHGAGGGHGATAHAAGGEPRTVPFVSSARYVRDGPVLPFDGDLAALQSVLHDLQPRVVVLGGLWGESDRLATPFGDRYGVQLHAAALAGHAAGLHPALYLLNLPVVWISIALATLCVAGVQGGLQACTRQGGAGWPGLQFLDQRVGPLLVIASCYVCIVLTAEVLAALSATSGRVFDSALPSVVIVAYLVIYWHLGQTAVHLQEGVRRAWEQVVVKPLRADVASIRARTQELWSRWTQRAATRGAVAQDAVTEAGPLPSAQVPVAVVVAELVFATLSLVVQSALPLYALWHAVEVSLHPH